MIHFIVNIRKILFVLMHNIEGVTDDSILHITIQKTQEKKEENNACIRNHSIDPPIN
jgi:hypothetical protein